MTLDLPIWSPFSQPWQSACRHGGWVGRRAIEGLELLGSSVLALPQAHYRAVHHWVKNGCRRDSNKYAAVSVDVIALMKRNQPGREQPLLPVAPGGWMALSTACCPHPGKTEVWMLGRRREVVSPEPLSPKPWVDEEPRRCWKPPGKSSIVQPQGVREAVRRALASAWALGRGKWTRRVNCCAFDGSAPLPSSG